MPLSGMDPNDSHWQRSLWWLLHSSPVVLAGSFAAGTAQATPLDVALPSPELESPQVQARRDRLSPVSLSLPITSPAPPEVLPKIEMSRSPLQAVPQQTFPPVSPEAIAAVEQVRSLPESITNSNNQVLSLNPVTTDSLSEQSINIAQTLPQTIPIPQETNTKPISPPLLEPSTQPNPLETLPKTSSPSSDTPPPTQPQSSESIRVTNLKFDDKTVFSPDKIPAILQFDESQAESDKLQIYTPDEVEKVNQQCKSQKTKCPDFLPFSQLTNSLKQTPRPFSLSELLRIADAVARLYAERGYKTSGAIVHIPTATQKAREGEVEIQVREGKLKPENIDIQAKLPDPPKGQDSTPERPVKQPKLRLNAEYIRSRLVQGLSLNPLNLDRLQENLRLLQNDPLIRTVQARLRKDGDPEETKLDIWIEENPTFNAQMSLDNSRSPSVGSLQRQVVLNQANLLRLGDRLEVGYGNTNGSSSWNASFTVPWNALNGTLSFTYSGSQSGVIEPPFDDIDADGNTPDIRSNSSSYELTLRQPLIRRVITRKDEAGEQQDSTFHEVAVGVTASLRNSQTSLLDIPFPLSPGADDNGFTRTVALRLFQEYTQQNAKTVLAFRSQFNLGLNALGATINQPIPGINEVVPDSRFFSWQGQAQWVQVLSKRKKEGEKSDEKAPIFVARTSIQLADRPLLSGEQFAIGGFGSVRGYRQDTLQTDNGVFASVELRVPILRSTRTDSQLQIIPFVDYGAGWNNGGRKDPDPNSLLSVGLGLQAQVQLDNDWGQIRARLDWGIPLISIASRGGTWQENGITFSLQWQGQLWK